MAENTDKIKEAFKATTNQQLNLHPNEWSADASLAVLRSIFDQVLDDTGKPIRLAPEENDIVEVAVRHNLDNQIRVLRHVAQKHKGNLDSATEALLKRVVNPTAFRQELVKAGFIKDKNAAGLKDLLE